jgi:hypothetical protein
MTTADVRPMLRSVLVSLGRMTVLLLPEHTLENLQSLVGGHIEICTRRGPVVAYCNDKRRGAANVYVPHRDAVIYGRVVIVAIDGKGNQRDLTDDELAAISLVEPLNPETHLPALLLGRAL